MKISSDTLDRLVKSGALKSYSWRQMPDPDSSVLNVAKTTTECLNLIFGDGSSIYINPTVASEFGLLDVKTGLQIEE